MLDIRFVRENPDAVKENIKKKFQDAKLPLVDEVIRLDAEYRAAIGEASDLRANRNKLSKQIGALMGQAKKDPSKAAEAEEIKKQVTAQADRLKELVGWSKTTTYTVIKKCIDKKAVSRSEPGFVCHPLVSREEVREQETDALIDRMYGGSADLLVANLLGSRRLSPEELARLKRRIEELE